MSFQVNYISSSKKARYGEQQQRTQDSMYDRNISSHCMTSQTLHYSRNCRIYVRFYYPYAQRIVCKKINSNEYWERENRWLLSKLSTILNGKVSLIVFFLYFNFFFVFFCFSFNPPLTVIIIYFNEFTKEKGKKWKWVKLMSNIINMLQISFFIPAFRSSAAYYMNKTHNTAYGILI